VLGQRLQACLDAPLTSQRSEPHPRRSWRHLRYHRAVRPAASPLATAAPTSRHESGTAANGPRHAHGKPGASKQQHDEPHQQDRSRRVPARALLLIGIVGMVRRAWRCSAARVAALTAPRSPAASPEGCCHGTPHDGGASSLLWLMCSDMPHRHEQIGHHHENQRPTGAAQVLGARIRRNAPPSGCPRQRPPGVDASAHDGERRGARTHPCQGAGRSSSCTPGALPGGTRTTMALPHPTVLRLPPRPVDGGVGSSGGGRGTWPGPAVRGQRGRAGGSC